MRPIRGIGRVRWKPRFTIGGLMIAIILAVLRTLANIVAPGYPALSRTIREFTIPTTGVALACRVIAYMTIKLISSDETS